MLMVSDCQPCAERQQALLAWATDHVPILVAISIALSVYVLWPHLTHH